MDVSIHYANRDISGCDYTCNGESAYFENFLRPGTPRFLVYAGARDGLNLSRTRDLIGRGWRGLLTEPSPLLFPRMREACLDLDGAICLNVALSDSPPLGGPDARVSNLTEILRSSECPAQFGVLLIGKDESAARILSSLDVRLFRPEIAVIPDANLDPADRRAVYRMLIDRHFRYCGAVGDDSVWLSKEIAVLRPDRRKSTDQLFTMNPSGTLQHPVLVRYALDQPVVAHGEAIRISWGESSMLFEGWAFADVGLVGESSVALDFLELQTGKLQRVQTTRCTRSDVATHFGDSALQFSGFRAAVSFHGWRPGMYSVRLTLLRNGVASSRAADVAALELTLHAFELSARAGLASKFLSGSGIEIGALQRALPVPSSCVVRYIDRMPFCDLVTHYPELASVPVQQPDLIDDGELLLHIADASQDFVIANHFFEHCKNPIHTLLNFARVLAPGGVLFMAVPDKRYTKDVLRLCTPYRDLLEAFRTGRREGLGVLHQEWAEHWENASGEAIFDRAKELEASGYSIHYNVWALSGLLEFLISAKRDVQLPFEIASVVSAENEVILILTRIG
ncbi:MAG: Methyltransferase type 11 [Bryobacterales bacterium]|nr:Methyltransferase type 11 [Bryobacterales bacterium]